MNLTVSKKINEKSHDNHRCGGSLSKKAGSFFALKKGKNHGKRNHRCNHYCCCGSSSENHRRKTERRWINVNKVANKMCRKVQIKLISA